jgi:phage-related minor tail protein
VAVEIVRSLADIDLKVKELNKTLRSSSNETRELDRALKLDNKNVEAVGKKMTALQTAVGTATQKVALLKQKQDEANKALQKGDISASEYKKIELAVLRAQNELTRFNNEIEKTQKINLQQVTANFDKLTNGLNKTQSVAKTLSKVALGLVATFTTATLSFVKTGDELENFARKFKVTAEELQLMLRLWFVLQGRFRSDTIEE